jgi:hypothetical protein
VFNDAYCRFMGFRRDQLIGKSDYDFFPKAEADVFWEKDEDVFRTREENIAAEPVAAAGAASGGARSTRAPAARAGRQLRIGVGPRSYCGCAIIVAQDRAVKRNSR